MRVVRYKFMALIIGVLLLTKSAYSFDSNPLNLIKNKENPYQHSRTYWVGQLEQKTEKYCGIRFADSDHKLYEMRTFSSELELESSQFNITHKGACGTCSTLQDLLVYQNNKDLTSPVRYCGRLVWSQKRNLECLKKIGFSEECAKTWYYNTKNTAKRCLKVCLQSWLRGEAYNRPDGSLNSCLACDEYESGPAFKSVAGRTRRNSGLISAIGRPESEIFPVFHGSDGELPT